MLTMCAHVICIAEHMATRPLNADHVMPRTLSTLSKQFCICICQAELPKTQYLPTKNTENADNMPDRLARSRSGLRDAMLSQLHAF